MGQNDDWVNKNGGRVERFGIAAGERLIGAELDYNEQTFVGDSFCGVTWLKWKTTV